MINTYLCYLVVMFILLSLFRRSDNMVKKFSFLVILVGALMLMLFVSYFSSIENFQSLNFINSYEDNLTVEILNVLRNQRKIVEMEMSTYKYPRGKYNISAT